MLIQEPNLLMLEGVEQYINDEEGFPAESQTMKVSEAVYKTMVNKVTGYVF